MIGTTSLDAGRATIVNADATATYFKTAYTSDWGAPVIEVETNKSNSAAIRVNLSGSPTPFYVAGAGWIYSQGNYLGSDRNTKDDIKRLTALLHTWV
ncbi:MAG TPA: hypothetical protein PKZ75_08935 [Bacteroidia bacterium]|nr:hypothetical protein [Bacteroidia bacterium]